MEPNKRKERYVGKMKEEIKKEREHIVDKWDYNKQRSISNAKKVNRNKYHECVKVFTFVRL